MIYLLKQLIQLIQVVEYLHYKILFIEYKIFFAILIDYIIITKR